MKLFSCVPEFTVSILLLFFFRL